MLRAELSGNPYNKAEYRRRLLPSLHSRSEQSVEFKHANISAILIELGFPFISGYKPRSNYQGLLYDIVSSQLAANPTIHALAAADTEQPAAVPTVDDILNTLTEPPKPVALKNRIAAPSVLYTGVPVNYLEREANNRSLGLAGEEFVINFERARLIRAGAANLASKIEHVARTRGDLAGFDVLSFEQSGAERLIEVKTTKYGAHTPFLFHGMNWQYRRLTTINITCIGYLRFDIDHCSSSFMERGRQPARLTPPTILRELVRQSTST